MAFSGLSNRSNGQVIDQSWFNNIKTEGVTLEGYVTAIKTDLSFSFRANRYYNFGAQSGLIYMRVKQDVEILSAKLICYTAGASGNTEVDVYRKRGVGSFETIFTTKPKVPASAGDHTTSDSGGSAVAAVLDSTKALLEDGDILRFDFTLTQVGTPIGCELQLGYRITGAQ